MTDSIDLGFDNYGQVFIDRNTLTGIAYNRIYSIDLKTKNYYGITCSAARLTKRTACTMAALCSIQRLKYPQL